MTREISYCLWCNDNGSEVFDHYASVFPKFEQLSKANFPGTDTLLMAEARIYGRKFQFLNGNVNFDMNPGTSFMIQLASSDEIAALHSKLAEGGKVMMKLGEYPWSPCYSWIADKFGTNWQLYTIPGGTKVEQTIAPTWMFTGDLAGKAAEAIDYYTGIFPDSEVEGILKYGPGAQDQPDFVQHAQFKLNGNVFMCMDSSANHNASFNESVSYTVLCKDQAEVDHYWNAFTKEGNESMCGWCKDKYGISWQVVPEYLSSIMSKGTPDQKQRVMQAFMKMRKFDIAELKRAAEG